MRTEAKFYITSEQVFEDEFDRAFQVANSDTFIHIKPFDLVESRIVGGVGVVAAVNATWNDDADRRRLLLHDADLHGGSVRAQKPPRLGLEIESVLRVPRRMIGRCVQRVEAMVFVFDFGTI